MASLFRGSGIFTERCNRIADIAAEKNSSCPAVVRRLTWEFCYRIKPTLIASAIEEPGTLIEYLGVQSRNFQVEQPTKFELIINLKNGEADRPHDSAKRADSC